MAGVPIWLLICPTIHVQSSWRLAAALVDEICRMLGAGSGDDGARRHAEELLARRA